MKNRNRMIAGRRMAAMTAALLAVSFPMNALAAANSPDDNTYQAP